MKNRLGFYFKHMFSFPSLSLGWEEASKFREVVPYHTSNIFVCFNVKVIQWNLMAILHVKFHEFIFINGLSHNFYCTVVLEVEGKR